MAKSGRQGLVLHLTTLWSVTPETTPGIMYKPKGGVFHIRKT